MKAKAGLAFIGLIGLYAPAVRAETAWLMGDKYAVTSWRGDDGLPGNAVSAIAPARDGYLWVGSMNGLARFDGARFVRFHIWDGLPSLQIQRLLQDRAGRLWIGTPDAGVTLFENGRFRPFARTNGLGGDRVRALSEDAQGRVWIAHDQGIARWDGDHFVDTGMPREKPKQPGCNWVFCGSNSVWAVGDDWVLQEWRDGKWEPGSRFPKGPFRLDRVFETRDGKLWAQTYPYGLARFDKDGWRVFGTESGLPKSFVTAVLDQGEGGLLCGTQDQGLFLFHDEQALPAGLHEAPEPDGVLSLQRDHWDNIWAGTGRGLLRLRLPRVRTVRGSERASIGRIAYDNRGRFWLASTDEIWVEQNGDFVQAPHPEDVKNWKIAMLKPCPAGGIWICAARRGLWEYDPDRHEKPIQKLKGDPDDFMGVLLTEDDAGGFWYGSESGLIGRLTNGTTNVIVQLQRKDNHHFVSLLGDLAGGVWVRIEGTAMVRLDGQGKEIERVGPAEGLPVNSIRCWVADGQGGLWMGSPMGLYWWHKSQLTLFDSRQGLPEDVMANLADDASGDLWCAAGTRLFRLSRNELEAVAEKKALVLHPLVVGRSSGLTSAPFAPGIASRALRLPDGRLFFPRVWDVIGFDPTEIARPEPAPKVLVEEIFADGHKLAPSTESNTGLRIPAGTGEILVRYTGLECIAPETLQFRYRFEGLDQDWSEAGSQRFASFRHLPPGKYRFHLSASVAGGEWSQPSAVIDWKVEPFFWQTNWFRALTMFAVVALASGFAWRRLRALEERRTAQEVFSRRLLESQEAERRRLAAELHDGLGQNLVLVKNLALLDTTTIQRTAADSTETAPRSTQIAAAAERALDEVHAISYALRPPELDRLGLARALAGMVRRAGEASSIRFETQLELDGAVPPGSDIQLFRIAQEAVNNIVKHSEAKTARVELWRDEGGVHLVVADDGRGLNGEKADRPHNGSGLGLSSIDERARLIGAQCKWISHPGRGTTLSVLLPWEIP